jgi:hypothetical protein
MSSNTVLLTRPGHTPQVKSYGWGEPPVYRTTCTCGWCGITILTPYYADPDAEVEAMIEPYRTIARQYGRDIMLNDNETYGTSDDAFRQALAHLNYDPATDRLAVMEALIEATTTLNDTLAAPGMTIDQIKTAGKPVTAALSNLSAAATRLKVWESGPLPIPAERDPDGLRLLAEVRTSPPTTT